MSSFIPIEGIVINIEPFMTSSYDQLACSLLLELRSQKQMTTFFIVDLNTYFVHHVTLKKGDLITAFYDSSLPVPLIFPPRYRAVVIAKKSRQYFVKVDFFNKELISSDHQLKLSIAPKTKVLLPNNQTFLGSLKNRNLAVVYSFATKSIPAITTPSEVIVLCPSSL